MGFKENNVVFDRGFCEKNKKVLGQILDQYPLYVFGSGIRSVVIPKGVEPKLIGSTKIGIGTCLKQVSSNQVICSPLFDGEPKHSTRRGKTRLKHRGKKY